MYTSFESINQVMNEGKNRERVRERKKERRKIKKEKFIRTEFVAIFEPIGESVKRLTARDVKNEKNPICSSVIACCDAPELLLTSLMETS